MPPLFRPSNLAVATASSSGSHSHDDRECTDNDQRTDADCGISQHCDRRARHSALSLHSGPLFASCQLPVAICLPGRQCVKWQDGHGWSPAAVDASSTHRTHSTTTVWSRQASLLVVFSCRNGQLLIEAKQTFRRVVHLHVIANANVKVICAPRSWHSRGHKDAAAATRMAA